MHIRVCLKISIYGSKYNSMGRLKGNSDYSGTSGSKLNYASFVGNSYGGHTGIMGLSQKSNNEKFINQADIKIQHEADISTTTIKFSGSKSSKVAFGPSEPSSVERLNSFRREEFDHTQGAPLSRSVSSKTDGSVGVGLVIDTGVGTKYGASGLYANKKIGSTSSTAGIVSRTVVERGASAGVTGVHYKEPMNSLNSQDLEFLGAKRAGHGQHSTIATLKSAEASFETDSSRLHNRKEVRPTTSSAAKYSGVGIDVSHGETSKEIASSANRLNSGIGIGLSAANSTDLMNSSNRQDSVVSRGIGTGIELDIGASRGTSSSTSINNVQDASNFYSGSSSATSSSSGMFSGGSSFSASKEGYGTKMSTRYPLTEGSAVIVRGSHHSNVVGHVGDLIGDVSSNIFGSAGVPSIKGSIVHTISHNSGILGGLLSEHSVMHSHASASGGLLEGVYENSGSDSLGAYSSGHQGSFGGSLGISAGSSSSSGLLFGSLGFGLGR